MDTAPAGLQKQPFHTRGQPVTFVPYHAQLAAYHYLQMVVKDDCGVGVFYGPELSGKTCIVQEFARNLRAEAPVAVVDATRLKTLGLLSAILDQFDPGPRFSSVNNCWYALGIFVTEHVRTGQTPVVILENLNKMYPSTLHTLCKLAELQTQDGYLLKIILTSGKAPFAIMHSPSMKAVARRSISAFELGPMTRKESATYLQAKLRAGGCDDPRELIPDELIDELYAESGGWPGKLDELAMKVIDGDLQMQTGQQTSGSPQMQPAPENPEPIQPAPGLPLLEAVVEPVAGPDIQRLFLTLDRQTLREVDLTESKTLIGRSAFCDVTIDSRFVSKHHALLLRTDAALYLLDLNSTNGTFVNSQRIQSKPLRHDDVISIGNHGIKLICPAYRSRPAVETMDLTETSTLRTLENLRRSNEEDDKKTATSEIVQR
jgi:type II secretory pathway predicted ATPase ExeA